MILHDYIQKTIREMSFTTESAFINLKNIRLVAIAIASAS